MRESRLEADAKKIARQFGWISYKGSSRSGGADQIFLRGGIGFCVEFKVKDNDQQANQINEQGILEKSDIPYYKVWTLNEFVEVLRDVNKWKVINTETLSP